MSNFQIGIILMTCDSKHIEKFSSDFTQTLPLAFRTNLALLRPNPQFSQTMLIEELKQRFQYVSQLLAQLQRSYCFSVTTLNTSDKLDYNRQEAVNMVS